MKTRTYVISRTPVFRMIDHWRAKSVQKWSNDEKQLNIILNTDGYTQIIFGPIFG